MVPHMPEVDPNRDMEACFAEARRLSAAADSTPGAHTAKRSVAVITPGGLIMPIPCLPPEAVTAEMLAGVRGIIPPNPKQAITVIAFNDVVMQGALDHQKVNSLIPFLGYLMG